MAKRGVGAARWRWRLFAIVLGLAGCVVDGGPHPEPPVVPDDLGPPAVRADSGVGVENPDDDGRGGAAGVGGEQTPPACTDAGIEGGWDDEDAGALR